MHIDEEVNLDDLGMRRKRFIYDRRVHYSYDFTVGTQSYMVVIGSLVDEPTFTRMGNVMPANIPFPENGMAEVIFDAYYGQEGIGEFRHIRFKGLGSAVVLQTVSLALVAHYEKFNIGGFVFQPASGGVVDSGRCIPLEETYDYMLGLKSEPRYNVRTGLPKKAPRSLILEDLHAYKIFTHGRANYVVL